MSVGLAVGIVGLLSPIQIRESLLLPTLAVCEESVLGSVITRQDLCGSPGAASGGYGFGINVLENPQSASWMFHRKNKESNTDDDSNQYLLDIYYVPDIHAVPISPQVILTRPSEVDTIICILQRK